MSSCGFFGRAPISYGMLALLLCMGILPSVSIAQDGSDDRSRQKTDSISPQSGVISATNSAVDPPIEMKSPAELELNVAIAKLRGDIAVLNARIDGVGSRISDHDSSTRDSVNWNLALAGIAIGVAAFFGIGGITYSIFTQKQAKKKIEGAIESLDDYKAQFESKLKSKLKSHERDFLTFLDNAMRRDRIYSRLDAEKFDDPQIFADLAHLGQADPLERKVIASEVLTYEGKIDGQLVRLAKSIVDNKN